MKAKRVGLGIIVPDIDIPQIAITSPGNGATVAGTIGLSASASDFHGVLGVQWILDGSNYGGEIASSPYSSSINTYTQLGDGGHTLQARARDAVGHTNIATIGFTVNNLPAGSNYGSWNPIGGGRRPYTFSSGNFSSPNYIDTSPWSWGGNSYAGKYIAQMRYTCDRLEGINADLSNHAYSLAIGGVQCFTIVNDTGTGWKDSGWFDISNGVSGQISFHDWATGSGAGGTAFVGNVTLYYQWR